MAATLKEVQSSLEHVEASRDIELAHAVTETDIRHLSEKVVDGDEALKVLQDHFEPFTPEESNRVRWKIDRHLVAVMLVINGIQFVDKNVSQLCITPVSRLEDDQIARRP
jgi:hypothetical protein